MKLWRYGQSVEYLGRRYRLDGMLGSGGMADVCLAWDEREQREVALKILKSDDLDQETLNRFMKEAAQIAGWQHPHILRVYETLQVELIDAANGSVLFYMVSEYARGGDLHKRLLPGRPFPLSSTFALFQQLCDAVQYAHERGVIHRDLKPLNMLFRRPESGPEEVVLSDFGLAVQVDASHHTFAHGGTLAYMAPEQFQGHALPASDIFALGVILYLLCTGGLPFRRTLQDMPRIVQGQTPVPTRPSLVNPELPPLLDDVILRALRELPAERYRQPREFWEAIALALTMSARTFPSIADFWQAAGQTWPYDSSEPSRRSRQAGQEKQFPTPPRALSGEETPGIEEGSVSALWIAREKQKASPVRLPLPTHSILISPNLAEDDAPLPQPFEQDASATRQTADEDLAQPRPFKRAEDGERGDEGFVPPRAWPGGVDMAWPARPTASLSGSTILPGPREGAHDEEQTSRRSQPFTSLNDAAYQTSQRRQSAQSGERQSSRRRTFEPTEAFAEDQAPDLLARPLPRRRAQSNPAQQSQRRQVSTGAPGNDASASPLRQRRGQTRNVTAGTPVAGPKQRASRASASNYPNTSPPHVLADAQAPSITHVPRVSPHPRASTRGRRVPPGVLVGGILVLVLLLAILAATSLQGHVITLLGAPVTTVTLQPYSQQLQNTATLNLRVDGGQLAPGEIPGRQLTATSPSQSGMAHATGTTQGKRASGQLTFLNNTANTITISGGTVTGNSGVEISFNGPITIPPLNPTFVNVTAVAVNPGTVGNISAFDIDKACCSNGIVVKNAAAFTGGQDGQPNSVIQQTDIEGEVGPLAMRGQAQAKALLQQQTRANERVASAVQCQTQTSTDQKVGALAKQTTVHVTVTCSQSVYDADAVDQFFAQDLQRMARTNPALGPDSAPSGPLTIALLSATPSGAGPLSAALQFHAQELWVYRFTPAVLQHLTGLIAGKSQDAARALLLRQPGISGVQFSRSGNLPVNASEIQFSAPMAANP